MDEKIYLKPGVRGIDALHLEEITSKQLRPDEERVRVHAASLNCRDLINGERGAQKSLIPLSDGAGEVEAVGSEVKGLKSGDRVFKFEEAKNAYRYLQSGRHFGKVVIKLD